MPTPCQAKRVGERSRGTPWVEPSRRRGVDNMRSFIVVISGAAPRRWRPASHLAQQREAPPQRKSKVTLTEDQERLVEAFGALHDIGSEVGGAERRGLRVDSAEPPQQSGRADASRPPSCGTCRDAGRIAAPSPSAAERWNHRRPPVARRHRVLGSDRSGDNVRWRESTPRNLRRSTPAPVRKPCPEASPTADVRVLDAVEDVVAETRSTDRRRHGRASPLTAGDPASRKPCQAANIRAETTRPARIARDQRAERPVRGRRSRARRPSTRASAGRPRSGIRQAIIQRDERPARASGLPL